MRKRTRVLARLRLVLLVAVLWQLDPPLSLAHHLGPDLRNLTAAGVSPTSAAEVLLGDCCAALGWVLYSYLLLIAVLSLAARAPGLLGSVAQTLRRWLTPRLLRGLVATSLGVTVIAAATPALASSGTAGLGAPIAATSCGPTAPSEPDWAGLLDRAAAAAPAAQCYAPVGANAGLATASPSSAQPSQSSASATASRSVPAATATARAGTGHAGTAPAGIRQQSEVVVRPGDSLWSLAATALGPDAGSARVAASWPRWWAANRTEIGADPSLLHPGELLINPD